MALRGYIGFQVGRISSDDGSIQCAHGLSHSSAEDVMSFEVYTFDSAAKVMQRLKPWEFIYPVDVSDIENPTFITDR